ncbi:MAG TPA: hypothetical protein VI111_11585 [Thermoleophilaceae bacterium]
MEPPNGSEGATADRIAEAIAVRVVEIVRRELGVSASAGEWIDAREVARRFGFSRAWVYEHAGRLGAVRVGSGSRPRLRFNARVVAEALREPAPEPVEPEPEPPAGMAIHVPRVRSRGA